jgi:hypothetical protein
MSFVCSSGEPLRVSKGEDIEIGDLTWEGLKKESSIGSSYYKELKDIQENMNIAILTFQTYNRIATTMKEIK